MPLDPENPQLIVNEYNSGDLLFYCENTCREITRLSKFGTLTLDPKATLLRADTFLLEESEKRSAAAAAFRKPLKYKMS